MALCRVDTPYEIVNSTAAYTRTAMSDTERRAEKEIEEKKQAAKSWLFHRNSLSIFLFARASIWDKIIAACKCILSDPRRHTHNICIRILMHFQANERIWRSCDACSSQSLRMARRSMCVCLSWLMSYIAGEKAQCYATNRRRIVGGLCSILLRFLPSSLISRTGKYINTHHSTKVEDADMVNGKEKRSLLHSSCTAHNMWMVAVPGWIITMERILWSPLQ